MNRAYSLIEIKAAEADGTIRGVATTPAADRAEDVVVPEGAKFSLPIPFLWQHNSNSPMGHVIEASVKKTGIEVVIKVALGVTDEIDKWFKLIKAGLVRGLSIGFKGIEIADIAGTWGVKYLQWEWLELSAVTIPANAEASITQVKSIDADLLAAAGKGPAKKPGVSGAVRLVQQKEATMNFKEMIKQWEATRAAKKARQDELMKAANEKGETLDDAGAQEYDAIEAELKSIDAHLNRLNVQMEADKKSAAPVPPTPTDPATRPTVKVPATVAAPTEKGIRFARIVKCFGQAKGDIFAAERIAQQQYAERDPVVVNVMKAAVAAGTTLNSTWAGALVGAESSVFADFVEFLRPQTILGKFGANGIPGLRRVPFRVPLVGQTSGGQGYWVGQGKAKPLTKFDFVRTTLGPLKVANIAVLTKETLRDSSPSAELLVRDGLADALRERLDIDFVNPAKAAVNNVSPASITNGVTPVVSSGNDMDAIRNDVRAVMSAYIAARNAPTSGVWIMSSITALALSMMTNPLGQSEFPGLSMTGGSFFGMPVIVSDYVVGDTDGEYVVLVNASDVYLADEGEITIDMSTEASLEMSDAPAHNSDTPTAAQLVSMFQTNSVAFLAERTVNWSKRRASAAQVITEVNWGNSGT